MITIPDQFENVGILDIATRLGIVVTKKKAMCFSGHDKNTPSLNFSLPKNAWHCFGCGLGGGKVQLVMNVLNLDFFTASKWIEREFNIVRKQDFLRKRRLQVKKKAVPNETEYDNNELKLKTEIYNWIIEKCTLSSFAKQYLNQRGLSDISIEHFKIRDIQTPLHFYTKLKTRWSNSQLISVGLVKEDEDTTQTKFVWWKHVIIFPFYNKDNEIIYLQARHLNDTNPKYINLYRIAKPVFNLQVFKVLKTGDPLYFLEGIIDCIIATENKYNALGILGAQSFKESMVLECANYNIRVIPDNDHAGSLFANSIINAFKKIGKSVKIMRLPYGKDFADYILIKGTNEPKSN